MRTKAFWLIAVFPLFLASCGNQEELQKVRQMPIEEVNLTKVADGSYTGSFSYGGFNYQVEVQVSNHRIAAARIVTNRSTLYAQKAEQVLPRIVDKQTANVDVVTGATTTSKALMKAAENALSKGLRP